MSTSTIKIQHITHASPEKDKQEVLRVWDAYNPVYASLTRQRLTQPFGQERYGLAAAFANQICIGTTAYILSPRGQGIFTQVYTDPNYRGQGIGKTTVAETVRILREWGGRAIYLAAWKDWVRAMYQNVGFEFIGAMAERHAYKLTLQPSGDDAILFRKNQKTVIRPLATDDQADLSSLFNAQHNTPIKHYELGCFLGSHFESEFFTLQHHKNLTALILDGEETIQGLATVMPSTRRHETHSATVDILVHPNHFIQAASLLQALETTCDSDVLYAYIASEEIQKQALFKQAGYQQISVLKKRLKIGSDTFDLGLYEKQLS